VYKVAQDEIDDLAQEIGKHTNMMIEEYNRGIFFYKSRGSDTVQLNTYAGMRAPLQTTVLGKTILASHLKPEVEAIIDRHGLPQVTESTITDKDELFDELETVRKRGYAHDDQKRVRDAVRRGPGHRRERTRDRGDQRLWPPQSDAR